MGKVVSLLWQISQFCDPDEPERIMFLTSNNFAQLAAEVKAEWPKATAEFGSPTPQNFKEVIIGRLKVINSGTEDQKAVDEANIQAAEQMHFAWKRDNLITGKI